MDISSALETELITIALPLVLPPPSPPLPPPSACRAAADETRAEATEIYIRQPIHPTPALSSLLRRPRGEEASGQSARLLMYGIAVSSGVTLESINLSIPL